MLPDTYFLLSWSSNSCTGTIQRFLYTDIFVVVIWDSRGTGTLSELLKSYFNRMQSIVSLSVHFLINSEFKFPILTDKPHLPIYDPLQKFSLICDWLHALLHAGQSVLLTQPKTHWRNVWNNDWAEREQNSPPGNMSHHLKWPTHGTNMLGKNKLIPIVHPSYSGLDRNLFWLTCVHAALLFWLLVEYSGPCKRTDWWRWSYTQAIIIWSSYRLAVEVDKLHLNRRQNKCRAKL